MKNILPTLGAAAALSLSLNALAANAATFDLAFIMDKSGSVADTDYEDAMDSLAAALSTNIPVSGPYTYTITVVEFSTTASTLVDAVEINDQTDLDSVVGTIEGASTATIGRTCYECALAQLGASTGTAGIINMMTDGDPNAEVGDSNVDVSDAQAAALEARDNLVGWDSLSFEAINLDGDGEARLSALAFDTAGTGGQPVGDLGLVTDPLNSSFVLQVSGFGTAYDTAISTKIQRTVNPSPIPVPSALPLLASGLAIFGFVARRRRKATDE